MQADEDLARRLPGTLELDALRDERAEPVELLAKRLAHVGVCFRYSIPIEVAECERAGLRFVPQVPGDAFDDDRVTGLERRVGNLALVLDETMARRADAGGRKVLVDLVFRNKAGFHWE